MIKRKYIRDRKFVLTMMRDPVDDAQLAEHVHQLTEETEDMHPFVQLSDVSYLDDLSGFTEEGLAQAGAMEYERLPHKRDKLAILATRQDVYNMAMKYKATSLYFRDSTKVFTDFKEAVNWLGVGDLLDEIDTVRKAFD